jgi:hypothetical protein
VWAQDTTGTQSNLGAIEQTRVGEPQRAGPSAADEGVHALSCGGPAKITLRRTIQDVNNGTVR